MNKNLFWVILLNFVLFASLLRAQYGGGSGTSGDPYLISSLTHLETLSNTSSDWNKHFKQTVNIDASGTSSWNGGAGWSPVGNSSTNFTGSYNGQGYTISGIYINRTSNSNIGFFGFINNATLQNIGLTGVTVSGSSVTGGLAGYVVSSNITNCYVTGTVGAQYDKVGGLIGAIWNGNITECYSTASVSGGNSNSSGYYAGGFVGHNDEGAAFSKCYSTGSVTSYDYIGGFIGVNDANTIENCYSRGNVSGKTGSSSGGGFAAVNNGTMSNCYSTGSVSMTNSGGFIYDNQGAGTISNCFWDTQTSGKSSSDGGTGKTTAEMKTASTFLDAGWSNAIWNLDTRNDGYPYLDWENPGGTPLPVELTSFTVILNGKLVILNWRTETEVNNDGFVIERASSFNGTGNRGTTSEDEWKAIHFVKGYGNSNSPKEYSFTDKTPPAGKVSYRLKQIDTDGSFTYSKEIEVNVAAPREYNLSQNYPNPFNPSTKIEFEVPATTRVQLELFNITGELVYTLTDKEYEPGYYEVELNAAKLGLASGVYIYWLQTKDYFAVKKLLLAK